MEAQVKLEKELRREEDEMFKVFQMERENEKRKLTDEIKKEWEVKLKELTDMYERNLSKKKKKTPEEERKVCFGHALKHLGIVARKPVCCMRTTNAQTSLCTRTI